MAKKRIIFLSLIGILLVLVISMALFYGDKTDRYGMYLYKGPQKDLSIRLCLCIDEDNNAYFGDLISSLAIPLENDDYYKCDWNGKELILQKQGQPIVYFQRKDDMLLFDEKKTGGPVEVLHGMSLREGDVLAKTGSVK